MKHNLGDKLWTVKDCKAIEGTVEEIVIKKDSVTYHLDGNGYAIRDESQVFTSKKQLIDQL